MLTFLWYHEKMLITFDSKQYITILFVYNITNIKNVV